MEEEEEVGYEVHDESQIDTGAVREAGRKEGRIIDWCAPAPQPPTTPPTPPLRHDVHYRFRLRAFVC